LKITDSTSLPPFFFNSIPKSGTHLMFQMLTGIPNLSFKPSNHVFEGLSNQLEAHRNLLSSLNTNEFLSGHIYYSRKWTKMLKELKIKQIFLYRDPRDVLVSYNHYQEQTNTQLYQFFVKHNYSHKERLLAIINGIDNDEYGHQSFGEWFSKFIGWLYSKNVFSVKYENLIKSKNQQIMEIGKIIHYLFSDQQLPIEKSEMIQLIRNNINPSQSGTFRKGKIGSWKDEFDSDIKKVFKDSLGKLLIKIKYENGFDW
jgi:sulfotransferase 6B1